MSKNIKMDSERVSSEIEQDEVEFEALKEEIRKEQIYGYGAMNYALPKSKTNRQRFIEYIKNNYKYVVVYGEADEDREAGYDSKGRYIGDTISFSW